MRENSISKPALLSRALKCLSRWKSQTNPSPTQAGAVRFKEARNIMSQRKRGTKSLRDRSNLADAFNCTPLEERILFSTYIVTTNGDGPGTLTPVLPGVYLASTLRGAITAANAKPDTDLIAINPFMTGNITLKAGAGELLITTNLTIQGAGANRQGIDAGGLSRVFNISAGAVVSINDLAVTGGYSLDKGGGGIRNEGNLTLRRDVIRNSTNGADGAGVFNKGIINVLASTFAGNISQSSGGGLFNAGSATVTDSTFSGNSAMFGGGLYNASGSTMLVSNSTVSGNHASNSGGGIAATLNDPTTMLSGTRLNNTIVAGNTFDVAGGGLGPDLYGFFDAASSNNLIGAVGFAKGLDPAKNLLGSINNLTAVIDAKLSPLGNYGGTTPTMPPLAGSPAIDAGNNSLIPTGILTDQRGYARIFHTTVDIGAVEVAPVKHNPFSSGPIGDHLNADSSTGNDKHVWDN
jgi:hypothetical protein